jgi:hypothetical protein
MCRYCAPIVRIRSGPKTCDGTVGGPCLNGNQRAKAVSLLVWRFPTVSWTKSYNYYVPASHGFDTSDFMSFVLFFLVLLC